MITSLVTNLVDVQNEPLLLDEAYKGSGIIMHPKSAKGMCAPHINVQDSLEMVICLIEVFAADAQAFSLCLVIYIVCAIKRRSASDYKYASYCK